MGNALVDHFKLKTLIALSQSVLEPFGSSGYDELCGLYNYTALFLVLLVARDEYSSHSEKLTSFGRNNDASSLVEEEEEEEKEVVVVVVVGWVILMVPMRLWDELFIDF